MRSSDPEFLKRLPICGAQPKSAKEEEYLREICTFEFRNIEEPGMMQKFPYGNTKVNNTFTFFDGGTYSVPRHVARHVESRGKPEYDWRPDGTGKMVPKLVRHTSRFQMRHVFGE
jgi:hypothetical protein